LILDLFIANKNLKLGLHERFLWPLRAYSSKNRDSSVYSCTDGVRKIEVQLEEENTVTIIFTRISTLLTGELRIILFKHSKFTNIRN